MGIVERELAEFKLSDGSHYRIEYNEDETIHIHIDGIRIVFSTEEFERFVSTVEEGRLSLSELKQDADD